MSIVHKFEGSRAHSKMGKKLRFLECRWLQRRAKCSQNSGRGNRVLFIYTKIWCTSSKTPSSPLHGEVVRLLGAGVPQQHLRPAGAFARRATVLHSVIDHKKHPGGRKYSMMSKPAHGTRNIQIECFLNTLGPPMRPEAF